jgi:hypothetical protein
MIEDIRCHYHFYRFRQNNSDRLKVLNVEKTKVIAFSNDIKNFIYI